MSTEAPWLDLAIKEIGTKETPGAKSNPKVMQYYADAVGHKYPDSVPWCAAFCGAMLYRSNWKPWGNLMARGALNWARECAPQRGAIVVFKRGRPPSGHVAFVEKVEATRVLVVGGNQSDAVNRKWYARDSKVLGYRWPTTKVKESTS